MGNLRLLIADDRDVVRKGVRMLLEEQPGWEVVAEASDGSWFRHPIRPLSPPKQFLSV